MSSPSPVEPGPEPPHPPSQKPTLPANPPAPRSATRWILPLVGMFVLVCGVAGYFWWQNRVKDNLVAAASANDRGVAMMEHFEYGEAIGAFEEAAKLAPNWTPARINLGIALLNQGGRDPTHKEEMHKRAIEIFQNILKSEPENAYAHFCIGVLLQDHGKLSDALPHFEAVTRIDPNDAHAWVHRGGCRIDAGESRESFECYEKAITLNPNLNVARYKIAQHVLLANDPKRKEQLLKEWQEIDAAHAGDWFGVRYTEQGHYADVIGKSPAPPPGLGMLPLFEPAKGFTVTLAPGTTWAGPDAIDELRKAVRARFGGGIILFDYNRDGKPDVLLLSAVVRNAKVGDLLLRNNGDNTFTDVTAEMGLADHPGSFGGAAGDYDNDRFVDLVLAGPAGLKLFRNNDGNNFEDKTAAAGFDKEPGVFLTAAWLDIDQDSDLDLVAAKYAQTPDLALKLLKGEQVDGNGRLCVFINVGEAPPGPPATPQQHGNFRVPTPVECKPLTTAFKLATGPDALMVKGPVAGIVITDVDGHKNLDLIVLLDGQPPVTVLNDRMLRFHRGDQLIPQTAKWNGGLVLDANGDDQADLVLIDNDNPPRILVSKQEEPTELANRFAAGITDSPPLRSAVWVDLDLDGRTDLMGLSAERKPVFLQGDGTGKFTRKNLPFGPDADAIPDLLALLPIATDGGENRDILCWSESNGLKLFHNQGNGNRAYRLLLSGTRAPHDHPMRTNADGVGAWVRLHAGPLTTAAENTTLFAGLGQSRLPLHFGVGKATIVDAVRIRWPDAVPQGEVSQPVGNAIIAEWNRKDTSCPTIFLWDGTRFVFHTDCLGAGSMGEIGPDGSTRPPRPEESVKIEPGTFVPKNGKYVLKIGEPMDEVLYLDHLQLDVIDHPAGTSVFPDERFATADPQPTQERLFFRDSARIFPIKAIDHRGRDVTAVLRERDGKMVDDFAIRAWLGFAEDHWVELDFTGRLPTLTAGQKLYLVMAGWTDYPYPESIFAADQAGVPVVWPTLEQKQANGSWKKLGEVGLPAGLPRVMTSDVTGLIDPSGGPIRIRTNTQIYWDQIYLAPAAAGVEAVVRELPVARASLEHRGFVQEVYPNGKLPISYNYDRLEPVVYTKWRGKLTRTGDVTELLTKSDDHYVICGPGDEITAEFNAATLPALPPSWQRSFVIRTRGYCKDTALATAYSSQVGPLPHRGMSNYPYDPVKEPLPSHVLDYDRTWNTRPAGGR